LDRCRALNLFWRKGHSGEFYECGRRCDAIPAGEEKKRYLFAPATPARRGAAPLLSPVRIWWRDRDVSTPTPLGPSIYPTRHTKLHPLRLHSAYLRSRNKRGEKGRRGRKKGRKEENKNAQRDSRRRDSQFRRRFKSSLYGARTTEIRRNRDRLAGSSVSIVGFYDGILTMHLAFSHDDNTGTALRGTWAKRARGDRDARNVGQKGEGRKEERRGLWDRLERMWPGPRRLFIIENDKSNRFSAMRSAASRETMSDVMVRARGREETKKKSESGFIQGNGCNAPSSSTRRRRGRCCRRHRRRRRHRRLLFGRI